MSGPSTDNSAGMPAESSGPPATPSATMFDHVVHLVRRAVGASFAAFCITDEPPIHFIDCVTDSTESNPFDRWLQSGHDFAVDAPLLVSDRTLEDPSIVNLDALSPWVKSFAVVPVTGPSAESGYVVLASDRPIADESWVLELHSVAAIIEERLDRTVEQRRIDQMASLLVRQQTDLQDAQARLELANKELEQFAYIAAHELVAPLRAVAIYAEVLEDLAAKTSDDIGQTAQACAVSIRDGVALMNQQVQYLLELSQGQADPSDIEAIDLHDVVNQALDTLAPTLNEADAVVNVGNLAIIHGKAIPLQSVFANLLSNAVRYRDPSRELVLDIRAEAEAENVIITVTDTGTGIDEIDNQRIFQLFERASVDPAGAGIGLGLSRRIVESFGGEMGVRAADPVGSTFWMRFPRLTA